MAASVWVASVSISASSARTASASASSSLRRAARCIRAARDCRRLCSKRERRFSLGRSIIEQILKGFVLFHNTSAGIWQMRGKLTVCLKTRTRLAIAVEYVGWYGSQGFQVFRRLQAIKGGACGPGEFVSARSGPVNGADSIDGFQKLATTYAAVALLGHHGLHHFAC